MGQHNKINKRSSQPPSKGAANRLPRSLEEKPELNKGFIWAINLFPCAGLIYVQGWKALKYVYWIWLLEFFVWRFDFAVVVYIVSSIAAVALASTKDWTTVLEDRFAELYPDQIEYNQDDGSQRIRKVRRSDSETTVVASSGVDEAEFVESLNADFEKEQSQAKDFDFVNAMASAKTEAEMNAIRGAKIKLKLKEATEAANSDTTRSAAAFMSTMKTSAQSTSQSAPPAVAASNEERTVDDSAYTFASGSQLSAYNTSFSNMPDFSTSSTMTPTSTAMPGKLAESAMAPYLGALPQSGTSTSSYTAPPLHSTESFIAPLAGSSGQQKQGVCAKCGAERNPSFSFCISCGQNF